ncbi:MULTISPECIES: tripartite tricarboxylate transporter substrate binding protein [unclassified Cupriavidus]|uniref:Bug family tripartite tricarboxylate transporter substrate binding protein n=1 Tax=unclassified Cupriavidus TaxID=2640874 RepID=UPI001C0043CA|nr:MULTISPECIES: tripartite tricarboxylate transporter substrate binding protein [unclassified Cupriavidus]MCA3183811.1 tripartite tricarboxylate transporter substrate binding protein [Cupriavidus sp.]MCA3188540.1 tripartite tricarboxylate transporter substrate binding protein [Cupriavidus sp.]MCA3199530.1 tripartite tricarboxylate transporter substrate binding protein [Cupriavidus sp.]MCA3204451.1 tripartite tricarboxylate transporter substrate binding protein [Cupriavidus sp.]MCA3210446.1 tr
MRSTIRRTRHALAVWLAVGVAGGMIVPVASAADTYPSRPIRLVVPFPPGGGTDVVGRMVAARLSTVLKGTVVVENVAGATGTIGTAQVARAAPDGYTIVLGISATHAIAPAIFPKLTYDPSRDFVPISRIAYGGNVLVANPAFPAHDVRTLIAMAKKPGADLAYGSWGQGSGGHLAGESLNVSAGIHLRHVPYKGVAPMLNDVMGGTVPVAMSDMAGTLALIRSGKVRALAVTGSERSAALPDVPTLAESGIAFRVDSWYALFAPARTPQAIVDRLEAAMHEAMQDSALQAQIAAMGMRYQPTSRAQFTSQMRDDTRAWAALVKSSGAALE